MSNDIILQRIRDLDFVENVKDTLISCIKSTKLWLRVDETADGPGLAILMVFVCYLHLDSFQDLLLCKPLATTTSDIEIFKLLDDFLCRIATYEISVLICAQM